MDAPPLPLLPRPKLLVCPPPQPGMIVVVSPPPTAIGVPPLATMILCVTAEQVFIFTPGGIQSGPTPAWPFDTIAEVYLGNGELLWSRRFAAGAGIAVDAPPRPEP